MLRQQRSLAAEYLDDHSQLSVNRQQPLPSVRSRPDLVRAPLQTAGTPAKKPWSPYTSGRIDVMLSLIHI